MFNDFSVYYLDFLREKNKDNITVCKLGNIKKNEIDNNSLIKYKHLDT